MNDLDMGPGSLPSLEEPTEGMPGGAEGTGEGAKGRVNYKGPDQRCESCEHFDGTDTCAKYQFSTDAGGVCDSWSGESDEVTPLGEEDIGTLPGLELEE